MKVKDLIYLLKQHDLDEEVKFLCIKHEEKDELKKYRLVRSSNNVTCVNYVHKLFEAANDDCDGDYGGVCIVVDYDLEIPLATREVE